MTSPIDIPSIIAASVEHLNQNLPSLKWVASGLNRIEGTEPTRYDPISVGVAFTTSPTYGTLEVNFHVPGGSFHRLPKTPIDPAWVTQQIMAHVKTNTIPTRDRLDRFAFLCSD